MKRKLFIGVIVFLMLFAGTAYAGTIWGTYKGNPIVKVLVNGKEVKPATPGQVIAGTTMLPVRAIAEALGAQVGWDQAKMTASVTTQAAPVQQTGLTLEKLNKIGESVGLVQQLDAQGRMIGTGSGFVTNGVFVTNWHVADGDAVSLKLDFGAVQKTVQVKDAVFKNETADLIGFRIDGVPGLTLNTGELKKGEKVYSLSYPHHRFQITEGEYLFTYKDTITHTAMTYSGSSGGAVLNSSGQVVGITEGGTDGTDMNYSIPVMILQKELNKSR